MTVPRVHRLIAWRQIDHFLKGQYPSQCITQFTDAYMRRQASLS